MSRRSLASLITVCIAASRLLFSGEDPFTLQRERMVREQIEARAFAMRMFFA